MPLLLGDEGDDGATAFSQYPQRVKDAATVEEDHHPPQPPEFTHMGCSVRTAE